MAKRLCSVWGVLLEKNGFACKLESLCAIDPGAEKFKTHLKTPETLEIITLLKRKKPSGTGSGPDSCSPRRCLAAHLPELSPGRRVAPRPGVLAALAARAAAPVAGAPAARSPRVQAQIPRLALGEFTRDV